jgi:hypothetical protein
MPNPIRYNLDLTGVNIDNRVIDEPHNLPVKKYRSIAPTYGPYFTESLQVVDGSSNSVLVRDIHYKCLDVVGIPTAQSGKEICTIIVITSEAVSNTVRLTYQALGGGYERTYEAIRLLIDNLLQDDRPVSWPNILNRPAVFEPSHHLHRIGDVIGFEYLTVEMERLKNSILIGDEIAHDEILAYVDTSINTLNGIIADAENYMTLMSVSVATDANNASSAALQTVQAIVPILQDMQVQLSSALSDVQDLILTQATSEAQAVALIQQFVVFPYNFDFDLGSVADPVDEDNLDLGSV